MGPLTGLFFVDSFSIDLSAAMLVDSHAWLSSRKKTTPEFEPKMPLNTIIDYLRRTKTDFEALKHYLSIEEMKGA